MLKLLLIIASSILFSPFVNTGVLFSEFSGSNTLSSPIIPGTIRVDATFENISVNYAISGDDNLNSSLELKYRIQGSSIYENGAMSMRAHPGLIVDGSALNMNFHAASAMYLQANTSYEIQLILTDPDGGSTTTNIVAATKKFPQANSNSIKYVSPGNGGGAGTETNPFLGLQEAANNAVAGDHFIVSPGTYQPFSLVRSGSSSNPISFASESLHCAIIDGADTDRHVVNIGDFSSVTAHVIIDGFTIQNGKWGIDAQNTQYVTIKNNLIQDVDSGYYNRRENGTESDQYITNNIFIGRTGWPGTGIPKERAIDIRGNNNVVSYNTIRDFADGISTDGPPYLTSYSLDIHNNDIRNAVDDLIEVDGMVSNARVYSNRLYNGRSGVSIAPVYGGPAYIVRNEIYNLENSAFKMNRGPSGLVIVNNTIVSSGSTLSSTAGWQNTLVRNNVVFSDRYCFEEYSLVNGSVDDWDYDAFYSSRSGTANNEWFKWEDVRYANLSLLQSTGLIEGNGMEVSPSNFSNISLPASWNIEYDPSQVNMNPTAGSPVINSGFHMDNLNDPFKNGGQVDRGALEFGSAAPIYGASIQTTGSAACADGAIVDSDNDGVQDEDDACPGSNDLLDNDEDGIPDDCDVCGCPDIPDNGNPKVNVNTVAQLELALDQANASNGNLTIVIAAGTYNLTRNLRYINSSMNNLSILGATGNPDDVVIKGLGWNNNNVTHIFSVGADHFTLAHVTIGEVFYHAIQVHSNPDDADDFLIQNVKFVDVKEQMLKGSGASNGGTKFSDRGQILCCSFEFTAGIGYQYYTGGIDAHRAKDWRIANNYFRGIRSPETLLAEHAIHMWRASEGTLVESNHIIDCDRGIGFGLGPDVPSGHVGGLIINNFVHTSRDVGIGLESSTDTRIYNNTVITENYGRSIEYRFGTTTNAHIVNNLTNGEISDRSSGSTGTLQTNYRSSVLSIFNDPAQYDYHLSGSVTGIVNAGTELNAVQMDYDCIERNISTTDIGADEYEFGDVALPLELLNFDVKNQGRNVSINWTTLNESDTDYFIVERRYKDDDAFEDVARLEAVGQLSIEQIYEAKDVLDGKDGQYYYRLRIVDVNGEYTYSDDRVVLKRAQLGSIVVYPNPTLNEVIIQGLDETNTIDVRLYSNVGQLIARPFTTQRGEVRLHLSDLKSGIYLIELHMGKEVKHFKIVKE